MRLIINVIPIVILIVTIKGRIQKKIMKVLTLLFVTSCFDSIFDVLLKIIIVYHIDEYMENWLYLLESVLTMFAFVIVIIIIKRKNNLIIKKLLGFMEKWIWVIVLLMGMLILFTITGLSYADK